MSGTKKTKVFILYDHPLFGLGLERLFEQEKGIEVVGAAARSQNPLEQLRALRPDVIMVEGAEPSLGPSLWDVLKEDLPGRVISVDLDEDQATVYTTRRLPAAQVADLVKAMRAGGRPGRDRRRRTP
ncbi:MAG: hypothetical protein ACE5JQ_15790 [Candidatus Methylomirabilales bacterium]